MRLSKDLQELIDAQIISTETAQRIADYYHQKKPTSSNRLTIAFGVLGATLVGLGIILILAHNWDNLPRSIKLLFAFLPLLVGQALCGFSLWKKTESRTWLESSATFLVFGIGASISLVSQIYNISGSMSGFLLTWILLSLPLIYLMRSSIVSLLCLIGITWFGCEVGYGRSFGSLSEWYTWGLLLAVLPHYYLLYKNKINSNATFFHNWMIPISLTILLGTLAESDGELMFIAYVSLFGLFYIIGNSAQFKSQALFKNAFRIIGAMGTIAILLALSFYGLWEDMNQDYYNSTSRFFAPELYVSIVLSILASVLLYHQFTKQGIKAIQPVSIVYLIFIPLFFIGMYTAFASVLVNMLVFVIGLLTIKKGGDENHLGILNYGLLVITALVICRFFDTDLSFVWRGLLFVAVGVGFFMTNYWMLKKRKSNEL